jgi:hypothetical protein
MTGGRQMRQTSYVLVRFSIGMFGGETKIQGEAPYTHSEIWWWVSDVLGLF